jgi:hypothetical protein
MFSYEQMFWCFLHANVFGQFLLPCCTCRKAIRTVKLSHDYDFPHFNSIDRFPLGEG